MAPRFEPVGLELHGFHVLADPALLEGEFAPEGRRALSMLANHLERISLLVPTAQLAQLRTLEIWIEREHPELDNMQYHPDADWLVERGYDARLAKKVHIPRARQLLAREQLTKHPFVLMHELAHAYHDQVLGFGEERIAAAFQAAVESKSYEAVLDHRGRTVRHYALGNAQEYFAESTEAYLYRNDFYPFVAAELERHDARMYALLVEIWGPLER